MASLGKALVVLGMILAALGALVWGYGSGLIPGPAPGRLPGDIYLHRGGFIFYFPITTAIIVSVALSLIAAWLRR